MAGKQHPLDPELQAALDRVPPDYRPSALFDFDDMPSTRVRLKEELLSGMAGGAAAFPDVQTEVIDAPRPAGAPAISLRIHRRRSADVREPRPCLYWVHGGGMVIGEAADDDALLREYAERLDCVAIAVDYRLAPEHPHPAPTDDIYAGLVWAVEHAADLGIDAARLAIGGASAGGGLAAATAIIARDKGGPHICYQLLICPMLDHRNVTPSSFEVTDIGIWDREMNIRGWRALLGELSGDDVPPYASPAVAAELGGLPPAFIDIGTVEVFRDECLDYAGRLVASGVPVEFHLWPGAFHGYDSFGPEAQISRAARSTRVQALTRAFAIV